LARLPWLRPLLQSRWPLFGLRALALAGFIFTIAAGLLGTPVGSHNFAIIFVWIAWWTALKLVFIPIGGRSWCSICPLPLPGEWLQQGAILERRGKGPGLNLRWPKRLRGAWLQSGGFLLVGLFAAVTLTNSQVTAWVLLALFLLATGLALVFERRSFCNYLCPIGGFTGPYSQAAPLELRVIDPAVCAAHSEKLCYQNCPWGVYPLALRDNAACGLCMECLRVCSKDNIAVNLRPFGSDFGRPGRTIKLDETFLALGMLGSVLVFAAVFTGPWGSLKAAAYALGSGPWRVYALGLLLINLVILPGLFLLAVWVGKVWSGASVSLRRELGNQTQILLPLGLFAWMAFTVSFAFPKLNLVTAVVTDPFGWGWKLLGAAGSSQLISLSRFTPGLQVVLVLVGLYMAAHTAGQLVSRRENRVWRQIVPVLVFCLAFAVGLLWLLVG
jgi:hypothetical protein